MLQPDPFPQHRRATATLVAALLLVALAAPAAAGPPAAIPEAGPDRAGRAFDAFAEQWMAKIRSAAEGRREAARDGAGVKFRSYGENYRTELKPTGQASAPYVGILRYEERQHSCADQAATHCSIASTTPVTEIFRYQNGRWIY